MKAKLSRGEIFDLLKEGVSDELLIAINEERDVLFDKMIKHTNIADLLSEQVKTYNRILDQNEKRLKKLLTSKVH